MSLMVERSGGIAHTLEQPIQRPQEMILSPEYVYHHAEFLDVTRKQELLESSRRVVAENYNRLASPPREPDIVYDELCRDDYDNHGRSRTIAAVVDGKVVGTVRLVFGHDGHDENGLEPLDAMNLIKVHTWPHREEGHTDVKAGELGRFAIPPELRTRVMEEAGVTAHITRGLFDKAGNIARRHGVSYLYAIMPSYVRALTSAAGASSQEIDATLSESPEARYLFKTYNVYWSKLNPKMFMFDGLRTLKSEASLDAIFNARYRHVRQESSPSLETTPHINLFELGKPDEGVQVFEKIRTTVIGLGLVKADSSYSDALVAAVKAGILVDNFDFQLEDLANTRRGKAYLEANPLVMDRYKRRYDNLQTGTIVEYPWIDGRNRFVRILDREPFYQLAFSRNNYVISPEAITQIRNMRFAIGGLSVGGDAAYLLMLTGAEHFTVADGGELDLHDFNRVIGARIWDIGKSQTNRWMRNVLEQNPYLDIRAHAKNIGLQNSEDAISVEDFVQGADAVIEALDSLSIKGEIWIKGREHGIVVSMPTDMGMAGKVDHQSAHEANYPFHGRLSPADQEILAGLNGDVGQKTRIAMKIVGEHNIPHEYLQALAKASKNGASYWPQPGLAAFLSAAMLVAKEIRRLDGKPVAPESVIDLNMLPLSNKE